MLLVNGDQARQVSRRKADRLDVMALLSSLDLVSSVSGHQSARTWLAYLQKHDWLVAASCVGPGKVCCARVDPLATNPRSAHADITEKGFNFLLMETHQQLWILVRQYISDTASTHGGWGGWLSWLGVRGRHMHAHTAPSSRSTRRIHHPYPISDPLCLQAWRSRTSSSSCCSGGQLSTARSTRRR